jgi:hypothetical protein
LFTHADQFEDGRGHFLTAIGGQVIEALDIRIAAVGRQLPVDVSEDFFHLDTNICRRRETGTAHVLDRIRAAHGRAAKAFHGVAVAAGGQHDDQSHKTKQPPIQQTLHPRQFMAQRQGQRLCDRPRHFCAACPT